MRALDEASEHGQSGTYVEYLEQEVRRRKAQIAPIERREQQEHDERVREYEKAREPYRRLYRLWREEVERKQEANDDLEKFVERAYREFDHAFNGGAAPVGGDRSPSTSRSSRRASEPTSTCASITARW